GASHPDGRPLPALSPIVEASEPIGAGGLGRRPEPPMKIDRVPTGRLVGPSGASPLLSRRGRDRAGPSTPGGPRAWTGRPGPPTECLRGSPTPAGHSRGRW